MNKANNAVLCAAAILPLILLFWPFAQWNEPLSFLLRVIPALSVQTLLCRNSGSNLIKLIPFVLTGVFAAWGTYLFFTSTHWMHATAVDLLRDYLSPFLCCTAVLLLEHLKKR